MENEVVVVLPKIVPFFYKGQKVLISPQIAAAYGCKASRIKDNFYNHKNAFIEGVDYFKLSGEELDEFKKQNNASRPLTTTTNASRHSTTTTEASRPSATCYISPKVTGLKVWTESGTYKLSQFINTPYAKAIFEKLSQAYFGSFTPPPVQMPKLKKPKIKNNLTFEQLQFLISNCTNASLRDDLIRKAAGNLEPPKCVYVLEMSNGWIKIGMTQDFRRRARQIALETGLSVKNWCHTNYLPPEIARDIESACHANFESCRIDGEFYTTSFDSATAEVEKHEEIFESMTI